jgi:hypothetical protein
MSPALRAVAAVTARAAGQRDEARRRVERILGSTPSPSDLAQRLLGAGRLTVNFHPDRLAASGCTVAGGLLADGRYTSQWRTGISNGSRSAVQGGERHGWERTLFADAYEGGIPAGTERPIYGAFDLLRDPHGGSPRFGSSYLVLRPGAIERTTLCVGDSHVGPDDVGTAAEPWSLLAGLAEQAALGTLLGRAMGLDHLQEVLAGDHAPDGPSRELDGYVEAQVHGGVDLRTDVAAIVLDPSFRGTDVEADLSAAAARYGFALDWHSGSELVATAVPTDFRGPEMPEVAARVARPDGIVDARAIGRAARRIVPGPPRPDGDAPETELQQLKYLWHTVHAFGHDAPLTTGRG